MEKQSIVSPPRKFDDKPCQKDPQDFPELPHKMSRMSEPLVAWFPWEGRKEMKVSTEGTLGGLGQKSLHRFCRRLQISDVLQ